MPDFYAPYPADSAVASVMKTAHELIALYPGPNFKDESLNDHLRCVIVGLAEAIGDKDWKSVAVSLAILQQAEVRTRIDATAAEEAESDTPPVKDYEHPCEGQVDAINKSRAMAVAATALASERRWLTPDDTTSVAAVLQEENDRVRGNRSEDLTFTWDDARLCLASTLRSCLETLDAATPS